ncbi:N-terminal double-transmembrane domain-containing protein [Formosa sp. Hel1_31_208]|uniref:BatA domain-containing protein n=1 Tax=Formosa sp. Hel1_31_208 TaxID=1798225 RepID=UPI00087B466C|nr:BatA domain-containing protein [Formosa sp. Hel1_31_208]SDS44835.1 N-terminal double-transmembrane domain-containing protein [Formosa sp. Hel1_31_208]
MQFKHPELLYALLLLIIPIIVHLFQLRKFKSVPFTNVQFLKELTIQTRKSSQLKKWLTLFIRLMLLTCIIFAFAQPYSSDKDSFNTKSETVIYLDNSFSMQATSANGSLLNTAIQDIIETIDDNEDISIFTNDINYNKTTIKAIKNDLIQLKHSPNQLAYDAAILKGKQLFSDDNSTIKNLVLISDFQQKNEVITATKDSLINLKLVQLKPAINENIAIDSVFISKTTIENIELTVTLKNQGNPIETLPVSLFNNDKLIAKTAVNIIDKATTNFTIPTNTIFNGKIIIDDRNLQYDNTLYFNIDQREKIKVLSINEADDNFLSKIYTNDEFEYQSSAFNTLNYNTLDQQNLIVLNELKDIPNSLTTALKSFTDNGGSLLIIPSEDIVLSAYNRIFNNYGLSSFSALVSSEKKITSINFSHPLLLNVFDKRVSNFQYPKSNTFYSNATNSVLSILAYEDGMSFLSQSGNAFRFSAAINTDNSNFKNSPLIVPVLYNIGKQSLKAGDLFYTIGKENVIDIATQLQQDDILTLVNGDNSVIPLQKTFDNKVELITNTYPDVAGIISVKNKDAFLKHLSFNFDRDESNLVYFDTQNIDHTAVDNSVASAINQIKSTTNVNELWKWFVIFAVIFLMIEMLILKFLK